MRNFLFKSNYSVNYVSLKRVNKLVLKEKVFSTFDFIKKDF